MVVSEALRVGGMAAEMLGRAGFAARVLASGSRAIYLEDRAGRVLWVSPPGTALHRRCVLAPLDPGSWREGETATSDGSFLRSSSGHAIRWAGATIWSGPSPTSLPASVGSTVETLERNLAPLGPPRGLAGPALAIMRGDVSKVGVAARLTVGLAQEASRHLFAVFAVLERRESAALLAASSALIGLGEGLTPSGDDFVGGMLFGLRHVDRREPGAAWVDWTEVEDRLTCMAPRTNKISHALLSDLAAGHGPEPLHALAEKTLAGGTSEAVSWHAARVVRIGHTSGWEMLAGFAAALHGVCRESRGDGASRRARRSLCATEAFDRGAIPAGGIHGN